MFSVADSTQVKVVRNYYKFQAQIYEATRWSFLFGRKRLIAALRLPYSCDKTIWEVGCGTGHNLHILAKEFPNARLTGIDISPDMLAIARKKLRSYGPRVQFIEAPFGTEHTTGADKPDIILFSYCLTMVNPGWEQMIEHAFHSLKPGGHIAVVDFYDSPFVFFQRWMSHNHVRMEGHLIAALERHFKPSHLEVAAVYGGLWKYFMFVGEK